MILKIDELDISRELTEGVVISIGRKGHGADIELDNGGVSRQHAELTLENGQIKIFDKNSLNHVLLNGTAVEPGVWHTIIDSDKVSILGYTFKFFNPGPLNKREQKILTNPPPNQVPLPLPDEVKGNTNLNVRFKELLGLKLPIKIGRANTNDIVLPDSVPDDRIVGRSHAQISFSDGQYWIEDLDSKNGTYVNDEKISPRQPRIIEKKDTVLIHLHYFNLVEGYRDLREEVAIRAVGISKTYANGFTGLNPMSVDIPFKQIVALMGPSGCGKSTLLKALNGDNPSTSGTVYIHGLPLRENYNLLKQKIGYVPQDDTIHYELSVEETLYMAAKLRLADDTSDDKIKQRIAEVLASLNFDDDVRNKKVGGLSGGQRKRVCIAVELLSSPTILFLDEPTSPLDPETIEEFLISLRKLAQNGTTIVMVTHKPEDLNYADQVIFMAAKGYFVYYGPKAGLTEKFNVDHIIKVYTKCGDKEKGKGKEENKEWHKAFVEDYYIKPTERIIPVYAGKNISIEKQKSLLLQFYWLSKRYLKIKINDRQNLILLFAQPFIIAGLLSVIFHMVSIPVMMLIAVSAIWFGVSNSSKEIVAEFAVYKRERMFNLNINTYILSKWVILSLIALIQVVIFITITHIRFQDDPLLGGFWKNVGFMFFIASSATLFGLFLSAFFNTTEKVLTVVPIALMPQIMLAGVVEPLKNIKIDVLSYFTIGRWGTEGLSRIQNFPVSDHNRFCSCAPLQTVANVFYNRKLGGSDNTIVHLFDGPQLNTLVILIISIVMYILTYYSLKKRDTI